MLFVLVGAIQTKSEYLWGGGLQVLISQLQLFLPLLPPPPSPSALPCNRDCIISTKGSSKGNGMKYRRLKIIEKKLFFLSLKAMFRLFQHYSEISIC